MIFGVLRNNFLMGLKINFKFEILGILVQNPHIQQAFFFVQNPNIHCDGWWWWMVVVDKKVLWFCAKCFHNKFWKKNRSISGKNYKSFLSEKIRLQFSKSGVFCWKKIFCKCLETSVIFSWEYDHSLYFTKKFQKHF